MYRVRASGAGLTLLATPFHGLIVCPELGYRMAGHHSEAERAIWPWKALGAQPPAPKKPMGRPAKACAQAAVMVLAGLAIHLFLHHRVMPLVLWTLAALVLVGGFAVPPIFDAFEMFGALLARWVAAGLTWGLLVPFFYLCFVPGRVILTLRGRDPMDRRFPDAKPSFWEPRPPVRSLEQYRKQH
jgi:hypothetical protein